MKRVAISHSGGKDSMLALHYMLKRDDVIVDRLMTTVDENDHRASVHETDEALLDLQAEALGLPLQKIYLPTSPSNEEYHARMREGLTQAEQDGITHIVFGDINLSDVRTFRENQLEGLTLEAIFPLWQQSTAHLIDDFLTLGYDTWITTIDPNRVPKPFLGRSLNRQTLQALPDTVDPCGENGEFHTFVVSGPLLKRALPVQLSDFMSEGPFYHYRDVYIKD
ncbi:uncharacterized protein (TIGR00290 family) [Alkalibacillus flavidus]|uniref:Uncharacterized protein (TIGR00290 family) n=1 Tax=Alkalibacillus flavidus TaxID=546021 RepID=A0ABV2KWZ0_9BACI